LYRATARQRFQLSTDGFRPYINAIQAIFGHTIDYGMLVKEYGESPEAEKRYSPAKCIGCKREEIVGDPDPNRICTSHIERQNLTLRMQIRRLTRLTNAFSKKWENLRAALCLHFAYYNFCRIHGSLRVTPAMEAGLTDHIWSIAELIASALEPSDVPPPPEEPQTTTRPGTRRFRLIVGRGGKGTNKPR
jgi:hypothetical protein